MAERALTQRIASTVGGLIGDEKRLQAEIESSSVQLKLLAEAMAKEGKMERVAELEAVTRKVVETAHEMSLHQQALEAVRDSYQYTGTPTNFEELLQQQVAQLGASHPCPEDHHILVAFRQTIRSARQGGEGGGDDDDEDDEVMMTTNLIVKNPNCPITMRHVEDLDDPVCCLDCRHVYEKSAILENMTQSRNCPVSGCRQRLSRDRLVCDTELMMALRELRARKATATAAPEEIDDLRSTSAGRVRESGTTTISRAGSSSSSGTGGSAKAGKNNRKGGAKGAGKSAGSAAGGPRKQATRREGSDNDSGSEEERFWGRGGGRGGGSDVEEEEEEEEEEGGDSEEEEALKLPMPSPPAGFVLDDDGEVVLAAPAERRTLTIHDPITNRSLDCVIRRAFSNSLGVPFFLLHPLDTPIMFFRISGRTGELQEVDDEEAERIMPGAAYALAKKSLHLTPSGFTLTLRGAICFTEDDVINLDTELGFGIGGSLAEGVDITTFLSGGQEYMIYTPFDPLMFVAYKDPKTSEILVAEDPELLNDPKVLDAIDEEQQFQAMV
ncbi:unnamed protein product, partial [Closterium sp. Yama58-4]